MMIEQKKVFFKNFLELVETEKQAELENNVKKLSHFQEMKKLYIDIVRDVYEVPTSRILYNLAIETYFRD